MRTLPSVPDDHKRLLHRILRECREDEHLTDFPGSSVMYYELNAETFRRLNNSSIVVRHGHRHTMGFSRMAEKFAGESYIIPWWKWISFWFSDRDKPIRITRDFRGKIAYARQDVLEAMGDEIARLVALIPFRSDLPQPEEDAGFGMADATAVMGAAALIPEPVWNEETLEERLLEEEEDSQSGAFGDADGMTDRYTLEGGGGGIASDTLAGGSSFDKPVEEGESPEQKRTLEQQKLMEEQRRAEETRKAQEQKQSEGQSRTPEQQAEAKLEQAVQYFASLSVPANVIEAIVKTPELQQVMLSMQGVADGHAQLAQIQQQFSQLNLTGIESLAGKMGHHDLVEKLHELKNTREEKVVTMFLERQFQQILNKVCQEQARRQATTVQQQLQGIAETVPPQPGEVPPEIPVTQQQMQQLQQAQQAAAQRSAEATHMDPALTVQQLAAQRAAQHSPALDGPPELSPQQQLAAQRAAQAAGEVESIVGQAMSQVQSAAVQLAQVVNVSFQQSAPDAPKVASFEVQFDKVVAEAASVVREGLAQAGLKLEDCKLQQASSHKVGVTADFGKLLELAGQFKHQNTSGQPHTHGAGHGR